ncbi:ABC transporter permease [Bacillus salacetis]|uniref:ABC transporter permease n=1 Tax=Bacillus salacetis TaxID=2315464 RepID=UPI003B9E85E6
MKRNFYKWLVILCIGFVILMVSGSLVFNYILDGDIPQTTLKYNEEGNVIAGAPFKPSLEFPFGTNRNGYDMFFIVLQGAQYTLGAAIAISLLSFLVSFILGIAGGFIQTASRYITQTMFNSFYFIPQSIIAYNVLHPLLWEPPQGFQTTMTERIVWQIIVLALITVPTTAILIANETREILKKEFILSATVLGGNKFFVFRKHLMPHLKLRLFIIFPKILIQVLLIIAHLSFFQLFFGGTDVCYVGFCDPPKPFVNEWAGVMAMNYTEIFNAWWIFMVPMLFFSLTILSLNGIAKGLEGLSVKEKRKKWDINEDVLEDSNDADQKVKEENFNLISYQKQSF